MVSLTLGEEYKLRAVEKRVLKELLGVKDSWSVLDSAYCWNPQVKHDELLEAFCVNEKSKIRKHNFITESKISVNNCPTRCDYI